MTNVNDHPWRAGLHAAKANIGPGIILWIVGVGAVLGYFHWPAAHAVFERVAQMKQRFGIWYGMASTALFAALIPVLIQQLRPRWRHSAPMRQLPYLLVYWALSGAVVDLFYRGQAWVFGDDNHWTTLVCKVAVDQLLFTMFWAVPYMVIGFQFKDSGYSVSRTIRDLGPGWFRRRGVPILLANWGVWIPTVTCVYYLPLPLQLPIQNLALCLWALILMLLTLPGGIHADGAPSPHLNPSN